MKKNYIENFDDYLNKIPNEEGNQLIILYIGTTEEQWKNIWKYPEYSLTAGRATVGFKTKKEALEHSKEIINFLNKEKIDYIFFELWSDQIN